MSINWDLFLAAIGGAGTVLGTIVATEKYMSSKFEKAVVGILVDLKVDQDIRHLKRDLITHSTVATKLQDADEELHEKIEQIYAILNAHRIQQEKLKGATRAIDAKMRGDDALVAAILMDSEIS